MQDPDAYAAYIIQRQLKRLGIEFTGQGKTTPQKPLQGQKLAQHLSKPLPGAIEENG